MFKLDNNFLAELGLAGMPEEQKGEFLKYILNALEDRVGRELAIGMTQRQIEEFKLLNKGDGPFVARWLTEHDPTYSSSDMFVNMQESLGLDPSDPKLLLQYASARWLMLNRPDYAQVVADNMQTIRQEIISNRDQLLS